MKLKWIIELLIGPLVFLFFINYLPLGNHIPLVSAMAGIMIWIAWWWLTEVVDLAVTSLLPLVLLPMCGIMDAKTTASQYNDQVIFLFVGGFILSFAIERWNLHQRISLKILSLIGTSPVKILAGVMFTTYIISMWMSNTATVMMLVSAVLAINSIIQNELGKSIKNSISSALLLGLAYSASIGGMATLVGTPTNMIFYSFYQTHFGALGGMTFTNWFIIAFPVSLALVIATFFVLRFRYITKKTNIKFDRNYFKIAYKNLGPLSYEEKMVSTIFGLTAILWFTRGDMSFGSITYYGWNNIFKHKGFVQDSTVAIFMAMLLFIIPSKKEKGEFLLKWEDAKRIPYDIVLLFGSGFALAKGFDISGLSNWLANQLQFLQGVNEFVMVIGICIVVCLISEFASNVASIQLTLPILLAMSQSLNINPLILMIPATLAASLGYIMPVATAPNTIVFSTKILPLRNMVIAGLYIDIIGIILISIGIVFWMI